MPGRLRTASSLNRAQYHNKGSFQSSYHDHNNNMASCKFSVQPPSQVQVGAPLYPPPIVELCTSRAASSGSYFAQISLYCQGEDYSAALVGTKSVSGFPKPGSPNCYVFAFSDLLISVEGQFTLRVDVYDLGNGATLLTQLLSRDIAANGNTVPRARACRLTSPRRHAARVPSCYETRESV